MSELFFDEIGFGSFEFADDLNVFGIIFPLLKIS